MKFFGNIIKNKGWVGKKYSLKDEMFDLSELISEVIKKYNNENISQNLNPRIYFNGRKNLIRRCFNNLIENSIRYGNKLNIELSKKKVNLIIYG